MGRTDQTPMPRNFQMALPFARRQGKRFVRIRAHINPLAFNDQYDCPENPEAVDWKAYFPLFNAGDSLPPVRIVDIGCGFGGLLEALSPIYPRQLILGMEIRDQVVKHVEKRLKDLQTGQRGSTSWTENALAPYSNVGVCNTNVMKYFTRFFAKGQLQKMFFLFPDPHFKKSNHRRRIISSNLLSEYAYAMQIGGLVYNVTDVEDLYTWTVERFSAHPLFERVSDADLVDDVAVPAMFTTDEARRVKKNNGQTYMSVWRRIAIS